MGQKIHPLGFRVGITKKHQSVWFARFHKHQYAQSLLEDRFLRQTLLKLLPQLFQKKFANSPNMPKISHIQIVRGLIPYEIGIQIHAQNCHMIKAAFEDLEVQPNFVHNLLKNHLILQKTAGRKQLVESQRTSQGVESTSTAASSDDFNQQEKSKRSVPSNRLKAGEQSSSNFRASKMKKDSGGKIEKRKKLFSNFRKRLLGKFIFIKNGKKITKKFDSQRQVLLKNNLLSFFKRNLQERRNFRKNRFQSSGSRLSSRTQTQRNRDNFSLKQKAFLNFFESKISKQNFSKPCAKFVNLYMSQTNLSFLKALKFEMNYWNQYFSNSKKNQIEKFGSFRYAPIGSQKKWSSRRFQSFEKLPFPLLLKLFKALQQRALRKMERLRKEYLVFGKFSKTKAFSYFQRIRFLQNFKQFLSHRKTQKSFIFDQNAPLDFRQKTANQKLASTVASLTEKSIQKKYSTISQEKNTIKFIDHLQGLVKQHRSHNLFLYLATISDARQHFRKIQNFTRQHADFLFGISPTNLTGLTHQEKQRILRNQVSKTFSKVSQKTSFQKKNFQDIFVEQLQKQRTICEQNIQLTPKISIQFYSVKTQNFETRASAVADSIVDDLEKRKAFRRVIKKAKEDLMKTPKVKGVKIQVSGRLNGAEIARSEWVRAGRVPLQTLRANIDYIYKTAQTIYGIIGVKVWIYKGYTKTRKPTAKSPALLADLL
jgi:ribosomal protein S3